MKSDTHLFLWDTRSPKVLAAYSEFHEDDISHVRAYLVLLLKKVQPNFLLCVTGPISPNITKHIGIMFNRLPGKYL